MDLHELLKLNFGYDTFRPQQEEIINCVLSGRDAFVLMPTGKREVALFSVAGVGA
ncbi:MAG: hypothetical protein HY001_04675 [Candidatus Portnoybacteria bacterium]|nr:hypothetical protein [Candidatus Portnoybacteria bacterium]